MYLHTISLYMYGLTLLISLFLFYYLLFSYLLKDEKKKKTTKLQKNQKVSIIIPAYNEESNLVKCINSLYDAGINEFDHEVIVVNDGSKDRTGELAALCGVNVIWKENEGKKSKALNKGIEQSTGDVIITLDADSVVSKNSIKEVIKTITNYDAVSSSVVVENYNDNWLTKIQQPEYILILFYYRKILEITNSIHVTPGPLSAFKREILEKRKKEEGFYFDEKSITEDHEIALWMQKHNFKIGYAEKAKVYTKVPTSIKELIKQRVRWGRGGLKNALKYIKTINPKYGDYMFMGVPLDISYLIGVALSIVVALSFLIEPINLPINETIVLSINGLTIISLMALILYTLTSLYGYYTLSNKLKEPFKLSYFTANIILNPIIYLTVIALIVYTELTNRKLNWATK